MNDNCHINDLIILMPITELEIQKHLLKIKSLLYYVVRGLTIQLLKNTNLLSFFNHI